MARYYTKMDDPILHCEPSMTDGTPAINCQVAYPELKRQRAMTSAAESTKVSSYGAITNGISCVVTIIIIALLIWAIVALCQWNDSRKQQRPLQNNSDNAARKRRAAMQWQMQQPLSSYAARASSPAAELAKKADAAHPKETKSDAPDAARHIYSIDSDDEMSALSKRHPNAIILFYATWCPHCKTMKPEFEKAAEEWMADASKRKDVAWILMEGSSAGKTLSEHKIQGFPTCVVRTDKAEHHRAPPASRSKSAILDFVSSIFKMK